MPIGLSEATIDIGSHRGWATATATNLVVPDSSTAMIYIDENDLATTGTTLTVTTAGTGLYVDPSSLAGLRYTTDSSGFHIDSDLRKSTSSTIEIHADAPENPKFGDTYIDNVGAINIHNGVEWVRIRNEKAAREKAQSHMKSNLTVIVKSRHKTLTPEVKPEELKARDTLRDMISEQEWRRYLTNGFILAKGRSNKWYQIFTSQRHINVYENGKKVNEICIHTTSQCPPTDHVINMKILVETAEELVWQNGNVHDTRNVFMALCEDVPVERVAPKKTLLDIYREVKGVKDVKDVKGEVHRVA